MLVASSGGRDHSAARMRPSDVVPLPEKRGLNRVEAAGYVGVSPSLFDEMVRDRRMPRPIKINTRSVWDRRKLDAAFEALPGNEPVSNPWDVMLKPAGVEFIAEDGGGVGLRLRKAHTDG